MMYILSIFPNFGFSLGKIQNGTEKPQRRHTAGKLLFHP